jgi:hypothetical protein
MAVKRFLANKDTTITNAYKQNMSTRATSSNMGSSDILEVYSIYGQASTSSSEQSRVLVNFSMTELAASRSAGKVPASGSVSWFLRMYNAEHSETLPVDYTMQINAITKSWDEGYGLDMEEFSDLGWPYGIGTTWEYAASGSTWETQGADFFTGSAAVYDYTASFGSTGTEDVEIDVSNLVEDWLSDVAALKGDHGFGVRMAPATASLSKSFYTKKFFAKGSEFFFKRPVLEARWDDSKKDHSGRFYLSSSLLPAADNINTIYLYNVVKGELKNVPNLAATGEIWVSLYSGSATNAAPSGSRLKLPAGGGVVTDGHQIVTGGYVSTGIYSASFAYASSSITVVYPVWHSSSTEYHTGSATTVKTFKSSNYNPKPLHVSKITNLKSNYSTIETARFRLHIREKDWNPTIYSKASTDIENKVIEDAYYKVLRVVDDYEVIGYGTGSTNHTRLSYDISGSYFDLEMNMFEVDYMYGIKLIYKINGEYAEQSEVFKFRVE